MSAPGPGSMYSPRNARTSESISLLESSCSEILASKENVGSDLSVSTPAFAFSQPAAASAPSFTKPLHCF